MNTSDTEKLFPRTLDEVVDRLMIDLAFPERTRIANMSQEKLIEFSLSFGRYIKQEYRVTEKNTDLLESCRQVSGGDSIDPDRAVFIILMELWEKLQNTNVLKVVK